MHCPLPSARIAGLFQRTAAALAAVVLSGCGSDHATTVAPEPTPTPVTTQAFVHVLSHTSSGVGVLVYNSALTTFAVEPRSGLLAPVAGPPVPLPPASFPGHLASEPLGRFVYVAPGSSVKRNGAMASGGARCYRVDAVTGALSHHGDVPELPEAITGLAATATHVYVGGYQPSGTHHLIYTLDAYAVDPGGVLTAEFSLSGRDWLDGYSGLVAADPGAEVLYLTFDQGNQLVAATPDANRRAGYRELATLSGSDLYFSTDRCLAADGLLIATGPLTSFALDLAADPAALVQGASVASGGGPPLAYVPGLLATTAGQRRDDGRWDTRVRLYRVGAGGQLQVQPGPTDAPLGRIDAMAFHPSGRFLHVAAARADNAAVVDLITYSVEPDGTLRRWALLPFSADDTARVDKIVVTAPAP